MHKNAQFISKLDDLFDIAHADALNLISIEEDRAFLVAQRQKVRLGSLLGIYKNKCMKEFLLFSVILTVEFLYVCYAIKIK